MSIEIRPATTGDYATFTRLVVELSVDDPIPSPEKFSIELVPTTLIAEDERGEAVGYVFYAMMSGLVYVRHLVSAPPSRRRGVGRALLLAVAERGRAEQATRWALNARPNNVAAIALYESLGFRVEGRARAVRIDWARVASAPASDERIVSKPILPSDDARVELATGIVKGQFASSRALAGRILVAIEDPAGEVVGAAMFDPAYPGASPFRVARASLIVPFLRELERYARPDLDYVNLTVEEDPAAYDVLDSLGAKVRLEIQWMSGPLPPP